MVDNRESDADLLQRFTREGDEEAFGRLVERHGPMVLRACRRILRREQDVEDAFQATFIVLADKAGAIRWDHSVGGWLRSTAQRLSLHVRSRVETRLSRERPLSLALENDAHPWFDPRTSIEQRELRRVIDDALEQLPEKYRAPVVLCYLEGKTNEEAARQLGWPAGSMSRRLERARTLLRRRLAASALLGTLTLAAAAALLSRQDSRADNQGRELVRQAMRELATTTDLRDCRPTIERLGSGPMSTGDVEQLVRFARKSERTAQALASHVPLEHRATWLFQSARMRLAAIELADAGSRGDRLGMLAAARRLDATCVRCHDVVGP